jgi:putative flippase GtrA
MLDAIARKLGPLFSARFLKFCAVGASGVGVNLFCLFLLADLMDLQTNLASALAIEASILSNFVANEWWTFRDLRTLAGTSTSRLVRFNLVSIAGGVLQWSVFVAANLAWLYAFGAPGALDAYHGGATDAFTRYVIHPVLAPPEVGAWKYASQLVGIGLATFWNFLVNFHWTWSQKTSGETP